MTTKQYRRHPLSALWGDIPQDQFQLFLDGVREHGILDPIILVTDDEIFDGWHRYLGHRIVSAEKELEPLVFQEFDGDDLAAYIIQKNARRRHLNALQIAMLVQRTHEEYAKMGRPVAQTESSGDDDDFFAEVTPPTRKDIADEAGVSVSTVSTAREIENAGLGDAVLRGEMPQSEALRQARGQEDTPEPAPPVPVRPTSRLEKMEVRMDELETENVELRHTVEEYQARLMLYDNEKIPVEASREQLFNNLREENRVLKARRDELQQKASELQRNVNYWKRMAVQRGASEDGDGATNGQSA